MSSRGRQSLYFLIYGAPGVGKTTLTFHLAAHMARCGLRVAISPQGEFPVADAPHAEGNGAHAAGTVTILPPLTSATAGRPTGEHDLCLAIAPADVASVAAVAVEADGLVLLATPLDDDLIEAYAALKRLAAALAAPRLWLVITQASSRREALETSQRFRRTAERFLGVSVEDGGRFDADALVAQAEQEHVALAEHSPHSRAGRQVAEIARRLLLEPVQGGRRDGLWERVARLFA